MKVQSNICDKEYNISDVCRIINPKQQVLYIKHGLYPIDLYASIDSRTGVNITVMIFDKEESQELYKLWCDHELE